MARLESETAPQVHATYLGKRSHNLLRSSLKVRLLIVLFIGIIFFGDFLPSSFGDHAPILFAYTLIAYAIAILTSILLNQLTTRLVQNVTYFVVFTDIISVTLLMHASGGISSGLGVLIATSIAASCLTIRGRTALLFAALGALAIITEQVYADLNNIFRTTDYAHAGLLGTSFFAISILTRVLTKRLMESERVANQRQKDLAGLAQLNEYIIQHMQTGIVIVDENAHLRLRNEAAWKLLGLSGFHKGEHIEQTCHPLWQQLAEWQSEIGDTPRHFRATEGGRDLQATFVRLGRRGFSGTIIFLEDRALVTEKAQQMKLASLGRLTASIAHEIRNPLSAISHASQLLQESPHLHSSDHRLTEIIRSNSDRVNEVIENVLQLSRRSPAQPQQLNLRPWLEEFITEAKETHKLGADALKVKVAPEDTSVRIDPSQLRQVLANLIDNAIHHFGQDIDALQLRIHGGITPDSGGPFLELCDNGPGIDKETQLHIFEPFFTTGHGGTGLGLYIARELCEANRARLDYQLDVEGGSCFRISFASVREKVFNP